MEYQTLRLIHRVNKLIDEVDYILETNGELAYLNERIELLCDWVAELFDYITRNNMPDLIKEFKSTTPLYRAMLTVKLPSKTRQSINEMCSIMKDLKDWGNKKTNEKPTKKYISFRDLICLLDDEGKDRFIETLKEYFNPGISGRMVALVIKGLQDKAYFSVVSADKIHTALIEEFGEIVKLGNFRKYYGNRSDVTNSTEEQLQARNEIIKKLTGQEYI